jgi:hypothetical protein
MARVSTLLIKVGRPNEAGAARKRGLVAGLAAAIFEGLEQGGLFTHDVSARRDEDLELDAEGLGEGRGSLELEGELAALWLVLVADVDDPALGADGEGGEQDALPDEVREGAEELAILKSAGLALVGVADDELLAATLRAGAADKTPLGGGGEAGAAHAPKASFAQLGDQGLGGAVGVGGGGEAAEGAVALALRRVGIEAVVFGGRRRGLGGLGEGLEGRLGALDGAVVVDEGGGGAVAAA